MIGACPILNSSACFVRGEFLKQGALLTKSFCLDLFSAILHTQLSKRSFSELGHCYQSTELLYTNGGVVYGKSKEIDVAMAAVKEVTEKLISGMLASFT